MRAGAVTAKFLFAVKGALPASVKAPAAKLYYWLVRNRDWSEIEFEILPCLVDRAREAIDVGANRGEYTRALAQLTPFVHAFEPEAGMAKDLASEGHPNVAVHNCALSDRIGQSTLRIPVVSGYVDVSMGSLRPDIEGSEMVERTIETTTLDELAERPVGFVKIDVEGHELEVLNGGRQLISRCRPIFQVEVEERHRPGALAEVPAFFAGLGYQGLFIYDRKAYPLSALRPEMTDARQTLRLASRKEMLYVNNFIFCPDAAAAERVMACIDGHFAKQR